MEIPQDIIDNVIAAVGYDKRLLKRCSLVSSSFLLPSRKQLFSRISLRDAKKCQGIHQFLVQNPDIQSFVRTITLVGSDSETSKWMNGTSLLAILRLPFCCLECFSIIVRRNPWFWNFWNWNSFSSELKDALSNIIQSSALKTLSLTGITEVPITFFLHTVHFTTLELHSLSPYNLDGENSSSLAWAASKGEAPMVSHTVIDRCVWHFGQEHDTGDSTILMFLPFMSRLRFFQIYIDLGSATTKDFDILSSLMGSLCISLTSPATLEHLEFNIRFRHIFYENLRDADAWRHLDSIATHPTGSRLQRVDININYSFHYYDASEVYGGDGEDPEEDEVLKAVLDGLPLLRTKGILFVSAEEEIQGLI